MRLPSHGQPRPTVGQERLAKPVRDFALKAQGRLCRRYRRPRPGGKAVIAVAIARELAGFIGAIAKQAEPRFLEGPD
jgi:transposase